MDWINFYRATLEKFDSRCDASFCDPTPQNLRARRIRNFAARRINALTYMANGNRPKKITKQEFIGAILGYNG